MFIRLVLLVVIVYTYVKSVPVPVDQSSEVILTYENEPNTGNGSYYFNYETSGGTSRMESSEVKYTENKTLYLVIRGEYSYTGPDGKTYMVEYIADERGYRPRIMKEPAGRDRVMTRINPALLASLQG